MDALEIIVVLIVLIIAVRFFLKSRIQSESKETLINEPKVPEQQELSSTDTPINNAEPSTELELQANEISVDSSLEAKLVEPLAEPQANEVAVDASLEPKLVEPSAKPQTNEVTVVPSENNSSLPQDSILKRHYLTHLCTVIETLAPPRPTDSVLCRHYETMIAAKIAQCLSDEKVMEQLISEYENNKDSGKTKAFATPQENESVICPAEKNSSLPQDSILRRHYLTHLCTMIEALAPPRPTDSVLCRHYETMISAKIDQCLNNEKVMEQLISAYENN
ncbi:MAG: hypothetical protein EPN17_15175 [Methylobacter sp.]|nr:MAG: hypothetical protein EPN17_15175 [Methylobacter sp.]